MSIYETHLMQDPRLPFIFHKATALPPNSGFHQPNWHENIEILLVTEGNGIILCDTQQLHVTKGDVVVINTNCLHSFSALEEKFVYRCLIVERSFCIANHFDTNAIRFDVQFRDEEIERLIEALVDEYTPPFDNAFRIQTIRANVLQIMAKLCRGHSRAEERDKSESHLLSCIKQAIGFIRSESARDLPLDEVADFVGLSKYYFAREFRRITGYTFVSYVNLTRCEKAKILLSENEMTIGEVGRACGFENQSYFTRTFRHYTGALPSAYREQQLAKQND